jgi:hypothetical protein
MFVESSNRKEPKLRSGAASSENSSEYAAPMGLIKLVACGTTNMSLLWSFPPSQNVSAFFKHGRFYLTCGKIVSSSLPLFHEQFFD